MPPRHPLLLIAVSSVCFAVMAVAAKLASAGLSGGEVAFLRFAFMLMPVLAVPSIARKALTFQRLDILFYRGVFGGVAVLLYFLAIEHMPVGIATLLNYCSPIFSVAFAALFLGEHADRRLLPPLVAALTGMALAAGGGAGSGGLRFGLWEAWAWRPPSSPAPRSPPFGLPAAPRARGRSTAASPVFGLLATAPFGLVGFRAPTPRQWLLLAAVGACSVAAQLLMTYAYRWVTNLQAGVMAQLTVVISLVLGAVLLGDRLSAIQILGSLLTLSGVVGVVWIQSTPRAVE